MKMTVEELLKKLEKMNKEIRAKNPNLARATIFEESGIFNEDGSVISIDEFFDRYKGKKLQNKVNYLSNITDTDYREKVYTNYLDALKETAKAIGDKALEEELSNITYEKFEDNYYSGRYESLVLNYEEIKSMREINKLPGIDKEIVDISELGLDSLPF